MSRSNVDSSWKSIFFVTFPIVLSSLSVAIMFNIDRMMVVAYSVDALNAVSISSNLFGVFSFLFIGITDAAAVYVGQYNGSKNYDRLAAPVWQMLYFSLGTSLVFLPIAYFSGTLNLLPSYYYDDGVTYQKIMMCGGPLFPMFTALAAFFVGQGRANVVTLSIILGSSLNVALDYVLIYGIKGVVPALGCAGAAYATIISQLVQNLVLAAALCSKSNRRITLHSLKFDKDIFCGCIKIGIPLSASNFLVMLAWYFIQSMVASVSKEEATIYSICNNIYTLAISLGEGLSKATSTVTANMIGKESLEEAKIAYKKFLFVGFVASAVFILPVSIFPDQCVFYFLEMLKEDISIIYEPLRITLYWISVGVVLESLLCVIWGVLVAGGDTIYPTVVYQGCIWGFIVAPMAVCYLYGYPVSTQLVYQLSLLWLCGSLAMFYQRYRSMLWYHKLV